MDLNIVYLPIDNFREIAKERNIMMARSSWRVLFATDGKATLGEVINNLKISPNKLEIALDELLGHDLIQEQLMSLDEFEDSMQGKALSDVKTAAPARAVPVAAPAAPQPDKTGNRAFDLKNVSDFIITLGGKGRVGQLAAHRVFLKIPPDVLKKAGVNSLNDIYKSMIVKDDDLKAEIIKSTKSTLSKDIPQEIFTI